MAAVPMTIGTKNVTVPNTTASRRCARKSSRSSSNPATNIRYSNRRIPEARWRRRTAAAPAHAVRRCPADHQPDDVRGAQTCRNQRREKDDAHQDRKDPSRVVQRQLGQLKCHCSGPPVSQHPATALAATPAIGPLLRWASPALSAITAAVATLQQSQELHGQGADAATRARIAVRPGAADPKAQSAYRRCRCGRERRSNVPTGSVQDTTVGTLLRGSAGGCQHAITVTEPQDATIDSPGRRTVQARDNTALVAGSQAPRCETVNAGVTEPLVLCLRRYAPRYATWQNPWLQYPRGFFARYCWW